MEEADGIFKKKTNLKNSSSLYRQSRRREIEKYLNVFVGCQLFLLSQFLALILNIFRPQIEDVLSILALLLVSFSFPFAIDMKNISKGLIKGAVLISDRSFLRITLGFVFLRFHLLFLKLIFSYVLREFFCVFCFNNFPYVCFFLVTIFYCQPTDESFTLFYFVSFC